MSNPSAPPPYEDHNPCTLALHLLVATGSHLSCQVVIPPTLPTLNLVTVILLATHSRFLLSIQCP